MARRPLVVGNWKMFKTAFQTREFIAGLLAAEDASWHGVDVVLCPAFTALGAAHAALAGQQRVALGAQNMHWEEQGAYTGEVAAPMLHEHHVQYVLLGHSERRISAGESDSNIALKVRTALRHKMTPIVAVGETLDEHELGQAAERVTLQTMAAFAGLGEAEISSCVVAYEPIWAIGSGRADTPENANAVMGAIRASIPALRESRILYGGSMKPENVEALMHQPNIDGGLIGGASLQIESFCALIRAAGTLHSAR